LDWGGVHYKNFDFTNCINVVDIVIVDVEKLYLFKYFGRFCFKSILTSQEGMPQKSYSYSKKGNPNIHISYWVFLPISCQLKKSIIKGNEER
jgi:hypothetical protein